MHLISILTFIFALCGFIVGILPLHAGVRLGRKIWMPHAFILRYNYTLASQTTIDVEPSSWASLHILTACNGSSTTHIACYKTHEGEIDGRTLRQDGKNQHFLLTGLILETGLSLQILATLMCLAARSTFPWLKLWMGWKVRWELGLCVLLMIGSVGSLMATVAGTAYIWHQTRDPALVVECSKVWIGLLWATLPCTVTALCLEIVGIRNGWSKSGDRSGADTERL